MKKEFENALKKGKVIKSQGFLTERGQYTITLITYRRKIYFFKWIKDRIVECADLSKMAREINNALNEEKKGGS